VVVKKQIGMTTQSSVHQLTTRRSIMEEETEYESLDSDEETSSVIEHDVSDEEVPEFIQLLRK
jgi:hypothetical protein